ncbi:hypothetical protein AQUCO_04300041v1 [Aquilegia coerulea]|uniref:Uncharacterized protein n=1 Tax=Aquilegia coerulea TaxID=218851 RepID=A0A2G5CNF2_AQUCA|nr:hypothetical protein AQUCO_04300041v1 [Aquilegia coerulea]
MQGSIFPRDKAALANIDWKTANHRFYQSLSSVIWPLFSLVSCMFLLCLLSNNILFLQTHLYAMKVAGLASGLCSDRKKLIEEKRELKQKLERKGDPAELAELKKVAQETQLAHLNEVASLKLDLENVEAMVAEEKKKVSTLEGHGAELEKKCSDMEKLYTYRNVAHSQEVVDLSAKIVSLEDTIKEKDLEICNLKEVHQAEFDKMEADAIEQIRQKVVELVPVKIVEACKRKAKSRSYKISSIETIAGGQPTPPPPFLS